MDTHFRYVKTMKSSGTKIHMRTVPSRYWFAMPQNMAPNEVRTIMMTWFASSGPCFRVERLSSSTFRSSFWATFWQLLGQTGRFWDFSISPVLGLFAWVSSKNDVSSRFQQISANPRNPGFSRFEPASFPRLQAKRIENNFYMNRNSRRVATRARARAIGFLN